MQNLTERIKRTRKILLNTYLYQLLMPHIGITIFVCYISNDIPRSLIFQSFWFMTYTGFIAICYWLTPKFMKK